MNKQDKILLINRVILKLENGSGWDGLCPNICVIAGWYQAQDQIFDIDKAQRFMKSIGITKPKHTYDDDYWWDPRLVSKRIEVLEDAKKRIIKQIKDGKANKNRKAR